MVKSFEKEFEELLPALVAHGVSHEVFQGLALGLEHWQLQRAVLRISRHFVPLKGHFHAVLQHGGYLPQNFWHDNQVHAFRAEHVVCPPEGVKAVKGVTAAALPCVSDEINTVHVV